MPIPPGARQEPGNKNRVILEDGRRVTRTEARNMGAQLEGFRNENQRRRNPDRQQANDNYYRAFIRSNMGREVKRAEMDKAKRQGYRFRESDLKARVIAARNDRPRPGKDQPGGPHWQAFVQAHGITGTKDWNDS